MDDDVKKRHVAVIEIGMAEVSSCVSTVIEGQKVKKGDQLGYFQFGGSSHAIIFDKDMDLEFTDTLKNWDDKLNQPEKQLVNSELATFKWDWSWLSPLNAYYIKPIESLNVQ